MIKRMAFIILFLVMGSSAFAISPLSGNIDIVGDLTTNGHWRLLTESTVSSAITSLTISGLNGNFDEMYKVSCRLVSDTGGADIMMRFNGDSGSNYGYQYLLGSNTSITAVRGTANGISLTGTTVADNTYYSESIIYAESGATRTVLSSEIRHIAGMTINSIILFPSVWNNTVDNITSIGFSGIANDLSAGSNIQIWRKRT